MEEKLLINSEPSFDLYTHMKINIKCSSINCDIHDSDFTHYCFTCRRPICEICVGTFHTGHPVQVKNLITFNIENIESVFSKLENNLSKVKILVDPEKYKLELKEKINNEFEEIENLLLGLKKRKLQEIENVFNEAKSSKQLNKIVSDSKKCIYDYFSKYKETYYANDIKDEDNSIFLQTYDLYNITISAGENYNSIINSIKDYYDQYEKGTGFKYSGIKLEIEKSLEEEKKNEILFNNLNMFEMSYQDNNSTSVSYNSISKLEKKTKESKDQIPIKISNENVNTFKKNVSLNFEKLNDDLFKELRERITKSIEFIETFKKSTYESFKKHGSLVDIEKTVKMFDEKTNKRTNFIKGKSKLNFSPSQAKSYANTGLVAQGGMTRSKNTLGIISNSPQNPVEKKRRDTDVVILPELSEDYKENKNQNSPNNNSKQQIKEFSNKKNLKSKFNNAADLEALREEEENSRSFEEQENSPLNENEEDKTSDPFDNDNEDSVKIEHEFGQKTKYLSKTDIKLKNMFLPKKKTGKKENKKIDVGKRIESKEKEIEETKYKVIFLFR